MRKTLPLLCIVFLLSATNPAEAQLREDATQQAPTQLYDAKNAGDFLTTLFDAQHFRMGHSYEMSFGAGGGQSASMGMYTNSMMWQFSDALAARVDVSMAHRPFGGANFNDQNAQIFLRNAEVAYRPSENMQIHFQFRQSPYGNYYSPYGRYAPYGARGFSPHRFNAGVSSGPDDLFWRNN
jgi:hypothetical protein